MCPCDRGLDFVVCCRILMTSSKIEIARQRLKTWCDYEVIKGASLLCFSFFLSLFLSLCLLCRHADTLLSLSPLVLLCLSLFCP